MIAPTFSNLKPGWRRGIYELSFFQIDQFNRKEEQGMSLIDEDEIRCKRCGHIGMWLNGDWDVECPSCGAEYSLIDEDSDVEDV